MSIRLLNRFQLIIITSLIVVFFIPSYAKCLPVEELGKIVVFLRIQKQAYENKEGKQVEVWYKLDKNKYVPKKTTNSGTGFIIKYNDRDYLVTAKHVAEFLSKEAEVVLNIDQEHSSSIRFDDLQKSKIISGAKWFYHPKADIAIHPLAYPGTTIYQLSIPIESPPKADNKISLLSTVYVLGFPLGLGVQEKISPMAKKVQIASDLLSIPDINPDLKYILLDQALSQGYSGSPIFLIKDIMSDAIKSGDKPVLKVGETVSLIGILSAGLSDISGGKISLIVPTLYLHEILQSAEFISYEKNNLIK